MLEPAPDYERLRARFGWRVPARFNIAAACCGRHADGSRRPALIELRPDGSLWESTFDALERDSNRLANVLHDAGVGRGARVALLLGQRRETLLGHLAVYKLGAIALPLFSLFGPDALAFRLRDSSAAAVITDADGLAKLRGLRGALPALRAAWSVDGPADDADDLHAALARAADGFTPADTAADDPALLIYTSGTTGPPKGALHAHRVLLGHLPGVQMSHELFPQAGDRFWTPADWAWIGGLLDVLLPSLYFGVPVVASRGAKFEPEAALAMLGRLGVRNAFLPPTALRLLRASGLRPADFGVRLRSVGSGGEHLGDAVIDWGRKAFDLTINEFYGQTEANLLVSGMASILPPRAGAMGKPVPGHTVAVLDEAGATLPAGATGTIAVRRPDPVMFLGYWNQPEATAAKFAGDWLLTGDLGRADDDGYLTYLGRADDVINSGGYRIGPTEVEQCLDGHPAVALCAVIGKPDPLRGEVVKAFIVPAAGYLPCDALAAELQDHVRKRLAAHEYPREVTFVEALPLTATGKVRRAELRAAERAADPSKENGRRTAGR